MIDFINAILYGDLPELLGELYAPTAACVAAAWAILAFASICQCFTLLLPVLLNLRGNK